MPPCGSAKRNANMRLFRGSVRNRQTYVLSRWEASLRRGSAVSCHCLFLEQPVRPVLPTLLAKRS